MRVIDSSENLLVGTDYRRHILASEDLSPEEVIQHSVTCGLSQICQTNGPAFETELNTSSIMLNDPQKFIDCPVSSILSPKSASKATESRLTQFSATFQKASEKIGHLDAFRFHLIQAGRSESLVSDASLAADEMFTNAIFNAPFVDLKTHHNPGIDRADASIQMNSDRSARLFMGHLNDRLVVGCSDPYGSLDVARLLARIQDCCLRGVSNTIRLGAGGAGIGSYLVYNTGSAYYVGVQHGRATVVCSAIQWQWSSRKRSEALKNLHWFQL